MEAASTSRAAQQWLMRTEYMSMHPLLLPIGRLKVKAINNFKLKIDK